MVKAKHLIERKPQIYTKLGNIEIILSGRMSDFDDAILLHKTKLLNTKELIEVCTMHHDLLNSFFLII